LVLPWIAQFGYVINAHGYNIGLFDSIMSD